MNRRAKDFVTLFNAFWYRDFPITPDRIDISKRALWTTHIASSVKLASDHLGLYTCFETGGRTDAVIQDAAQHVWAKVEWEWAQPNRPTVNEITKLAEASNEADLFIYVGYSRGDQHQKNIESISAQWGATDKPLLAFLVTFSYSRGKRHFEEFQTHEFVKGRHKMHRAQKALPWEVPGTKWMASAGALSCDS